jgi:hypothetical protein
MMLRLNWNLMTTTHVSDLNLLLPYCGSSLFAPIYKLSTSITRFHTRGCDPLDLLHFSYGVTTDESTICNFFSWNISSTIYDDELMVSLLHCVDRGFRKVQHHKPCANNLDQWEH